MDKFNFLNQFPDGVIVVNKTGEVVFKNNTFKRWFKNFLNLNKFSHNLNFDICPLNSDNIEVYSPIYHALNSCENFFAYVSYEFAQNKILYYNLTVIKKSRYTILFFTDVTAKNELDEYKEEISKLQESCQKLVDENKDLQKIRQKAQSQAIRIALINKVSNIIRASMDISKILHSALQELSMMFGSYKAYYASSYDDDFVLEEIYG